MHRSKRASGLVGTRWQVSAHGHRMVRQRLTLDVVAEHLAVALGAALAESLASLSATRHDEELVVVVQ